MRLKKHIIIIGIILIIVIVGVIIYFNTCLTCRMENKNKNCDIDNDCTALTSALQSPTEVFLLSASAVSIEHSKQTHLFFGLKNVFAQNLIVYPEVICTKYPENENMNKNRIAIVKQIEIPYNDTKVYSIYINAPNEVRNYMCVLTLYNDAGYNEVFSRKTFTLNVI